MTFRALVNSYGNRAINRHWRLQQKLFKSFQIEVPPTEVPTSGDILLSGLNEDQDISIKIVTCREIVQESMMKNDLQLFPARALGELITCTLMMGSGLKNNESLQINLVGRSGLRNIMAITDSELKVRGMVGNNMKIPGNSSIYITPTTLLGGEGEIQVVRNHPSYKTPTNGIVALRDTTVATNLALYLAESEQRRAAMITDVKIDGSLCRNALGILVETLPGASDENVEKCIANLEIIQAKGLSSYLQRTAEERLLHEQQGEGTFRSFESCLQRVLDDCLIGLGQSISWLKTPAYSCSCSDEKIWRVLRLMPKSEVIELIETQNSVEVCNIIFNTNIMISKVYLSIKIHYLFELSFFCIINF